MTAPSPSPVLAPQPHRPKAGAVVAGLAAVAAVVGIWSGFAPGGGDAVPPDHAAAMAESFRAFSGTLPAVDLGDPDERARAQAALDLPEPQARAAMADALGGRVGMAWLTLWDNFDNDGDVVQVTAGGYTRTVQIRNEPVTIALPLPPGATIALAGVRDGGGGITVALSTSGGELAVPPLHPGQTVVLPVR